MQIPDWLAYMVAVSSILTPFVVLWLRFGAEARKRVMEEVRADVSKLERNIGSEMASFRVIVGKDFDELKREVREGQNECREDIRAVVTQLGEYPRRQELNETIRELRQRLDRIGMS